MIFCEKRGKSPRVPTENHIIIRDFFSELIFGVVTNTNNFRYGEIQALDRKQPQ